MPPTFPGSYTFIRQVGDEQQNPTLAADIARLPPVERALSWIALAADPRTDEPSKQDLIGRVSAEINVLQGGLTAIKSAMEYMSKYHGAAAPDHPGFGAAPAPRPRAMMTTRPAQAGYPGINSAPIDPGDLGYAGPSREQQRRQQMNEQDRQRQMQEHYARVGVDEGMSGGPPRPDSGVNQSVNQQGVPIAPGTPEQVMGESTWKQENNPPFEPSNTDDGMGHLLATDPDTPGREASGMAGHVGRVRDAGQPTQGAHGAAGAGTGATGEEVARSHQAQQEVARALREGASEEDVNEIQQQQRQAKKPGQKK
jgi:hypothetical protein